MSFEITSAGPLSTIQDLGRTFQRGNGFGTLGVMDRLSYITLNRLLGNPDNAPCIEMTLQGVCGVFHKKTYFSYGGAEFPATLSGKEIVPYTIYLANSGDELVFGTATRGTRGYLCVLGGFEVPLSLGSASTDIKCKLGGFCGRKLIVGDQIPIRSKKTLRKLENKSTKPPYEIKRDIVVRVMLGPQDDYFTQEGIETFLSSRYRMTLNSDRMGARFSGLRIQAKSGVDIISDGIVPGAIQIPKEGMPIVLLSDSQTTGGYAKIACVISADLHLFAQLRPGDSVHFQKVSLEGAIKAKASQEKSLIKRTIL